jgi:hypothetical protein
MESLAVQHHAKYREHQAVERVRQTKSHTVFQNVYILPMYAAAFSAAIGISAYHTAAAHG